MKNKRDRLDDYEVFYMEIPQADYLDDIEIQDEYDNSPYDQIQGLSDQQVSEIAKDALDVAKRHSAGDQSDAGTDDTDQK
jgi:hypothetical protein